MKKLFITFFLMLLISSLAFAVDFAPTKLELTLPGEVVYEFDGSILEIPINVTGTNAKTWFFVYTKDKGGEIGEVQNGYLGWHYVNGIDTCVYMSTETDHAVGDGTITWDGTDNDGGSVPPDVYSYYVFGFDHETPPESQPAIPSNVRFYKEDGILVKQLGEDGMPLANPYMTAISSNNDNPSIVHKWVLGGDPLNPDLTETTDLQVPIEYAYQIPRPVMPKFDDHSTIYYATSNKDALIITLRRATWIPNDLAELDTEWGIESAECFRNVLGPIDWGDGLLAWGKSDVNSTEVCTMSYISDYDGDFVAQFQNDFWIKPDEYANGATQLQGGPRWHTSVDGSGILTQATYFVLHALADPARYLENSEYSDFTLAFNQNGDYVLDRSTEPDAPFPWMNFSEGAPYPRECYSDANMFSVANCRGMGAVSFALLAPDHTGVGYIPFAAEEGNSRPVAIIDNGSAYDGMYVGGQMQDGIGEGYCAQDSFKGIITFEVLVADDAPSAFAVAQNSPNPANPTTTIGFTLPEAGNVSVDVFNVAGQKVDTLVNDFMDSGKHSLVWDGSNVSTGVYFYTVTSGEFSKTMKMTLLK